MKLAFKRKLFEAHELECGDNELDDYLISLGKDYLALLEQIKEKLSRGATSDDRLKLVTLAPKSWSRSSRDARTGGLSPPSALFEPPLGSF